MATLKNYNELAVLKRTVFKIQLSHCQLSTISLSCFSCSLFSELITEYAHSCQSESLFSPFTRSLFFPFFGSMLWPSRSRLVLPLELLGQQQERTIQGTV